jgi:serine O-acetyltransferase
MERPTAPSIVSDAEITPWRAWRADLRRYTSKMKGAGPLRAFYYLSSEETLWAIGVYRLNQALGRVRVPILGGMLRAIGRMFYLHVRRNYGIDLPATARIGPGLYIGHAGGIVIHSDAVIGACCAMTHGVTIGVGGSGDRRGVPRIGSHVFISSGAKIYGRIEVGDYVIIRPNATVSRPVPTLSAVGGVPGVVTGSVARDDVLRLLFGADFAQEGPDSPRSA